MGTISKKIFSQIKPDADIITPLYTVPADSQAKGTIYISVNHGSHDRDRVSVGLVPASYYNDGQPVSVPVGNTWIMNSTEFYGQVPIYLQQICLNEGDAINVYSLKGECQFTYLGDLYED